MHSKEIIKALESPRNYGYCSGLGSQLCKVKELLTAQLQEPDFLLLLYNPCSHYSFQRYFSNAYSFFFLCFPVKGHNIIIFLIRVLHFVRFLSNNFLLRYCDHCRAGHRSLVDWSRIKKITDSSTHTSKVDEGIFSAVPLYWDNGVPQSKYTDLWLQQLINKIFPTFLFDRSLSLDWFLSNRNYSR